MNNVQYESDVEKDDAVSPNGCITNKEGYRLNSME